MKKYCFLAAALTLAGTITGCAGAPEGEPFTPASSRPAVVMQSVAAPAISAAPIVLPVSSQTPATAKSLTFEQMGKVQNVFPIDGKTVLVVGSKLYLYQPADGTVLAESKVDYTVQHCATYRDGFLLVGMNMPSSNNGGMMSGGSIQYFFELYDKNLKKTTVVALDHVSEMEWPGDPQVSVSPDGKKLCYATLSGLYLYDIAAQKESKLLAFADPTQKNAGIATITQPYFTHDGESIGFLAQSLSVPVVQGQQSYPTCGLIGVDGKNLVNKKPDQFSIYEQIGGYNRYALFSQDFRRPSGQVLKMEVPDGKLSYLKTSDVKESGCVFGSDQGAYYMTTYLQESSWVVRIYDTATNKQLSEKTIACTNVAYTYQAPTIRVLDETKTCIVLLGDRQSDLETSVTTFQF